MKRLTKRTNEIYEPVNIFYLEWIGACLFRLAAIEDILGEEYNLDELREVVATLQREQDKKGGSSE